MVQKNLSILDDFPPVSQETWRSVVEKDLKGAPFEKKLITHTHEGLDIQPVYTEQDWPSEGDPSGMPGFSPWTRASHVMGNRLCGWDIRMEQAHPDLTVSNKAILKDLSRGSTSLLLRMDVAGRSTAGAIDPQGEAVGLDGMPVHRAADFDVLLKDVQLELAGVVLEAGANFAAVAATYLAMLEQRGCDLKQVWGAFHADPLAVLARDGELPMPIDQAMAELAGLAMFTHEHLPRVTAVRVGTGPYHHAGANSAQDLAISMASGLAYLRAMDAAGMNLADAAKQMTFAFSLGCNQFLAIAKLRAARKLWAAILTQCGLSLDEDPQLEMKIQARTSKRVITSRDPWVNLLRNTVTTFAAAVGQAGAIITEPFDAALGLPDDFSRRIARNTQVILQEESHLSRVVDPAGGSWFIEKLTDQLVDAAWPVFQQIEKQGGMAKVLESGWLLQQIDQAFASRQKNLATRKEAITGVSEFPMLSEKPIEKQPVDFEAVRSASNKRAEQAEVDQAAAEGALKALPRIQLEAGDDLNQMMPVLINAAAAGLDVGSIAKALGRSARAATASPIHPHPFAQAFERLRDASDQYQALTGTRPGIFFANLGPVAHYTARTGYSVNFFQAGGLEPIHADKGFGSKDADWSEVASEVASAFAASDARVAVICSSDKIYPEAVPVVAKALREAGCESVVLAGHPGQMKDTYDQAGVDRYIYMKCDVLGTLESLLKDLGVIEA